MKMSLGRGYDYRLPTGEFAPPLPLEMHVEFVVDYIRA